jgi:hypothetical protein
VKYALSGWELSGIVTYNTGLPATVTSALGNDPGGLGSVNNAASVAGGRPDAVGDPNTGEGIRTVNKWFNTAAFAEVPVGQHRPGNAGRSTIRTPNLARWDFSIFKQVPLTERFKLQLRGEAGPRQIANPKLGLTHNLGGAPGRCVSFVSIVGL